MDVCDYTVETYTVKTCFIFRHPKKNTLRNPFLKPFTQSVWLLSLNVGIVCWIMLIVVLKVEDHYNSDETRKVHVNPSSETALITIAAVSQQGTSNELQLYSGRIIFLTLFLWALVMFQFYSADIVGSLIAAPPRYIVTLRDLVDSDLHLAAEDIPYTRDYFRLTKDPSSVYLWEKKLKPSRKKKTFVNSRDGLHQVSLGGYGFFIDTATAYKTIEDTFTQAQICDLSEIPVIPPQYVTLVTAKNSPFRKMITYG
ncbi:uncharacterized protein LOC111644053 [Copidosoma floridanum]|nr:uncharacterized protein LOC111644053 [Copidosoma floridanum]